MPFRGLAQPKRLLILASILPLTGLALILPYLLALPIYGDEVQWKLVSSRLLIDGKLVYLFPACATGFLLDPPLTAYPLRLIEAALYADASDPRSLRLPAVGIFLAILLYLGWLAWRIAGGLIPLLAALGIVVAGLSLGVLPFLEVLNRPEQSIVVLVLIACTLPVLVSTDPARSGWRPWIFAAIYAFLGCQLVAAHIKAIFFLPAIAFSAFVMIRRPLPLALSLAVISFGVVETYRFWQARTSCPESEFLTFMFRSVSLSPADLVDGPSRFVTRAYANFRALGTYWQSTKFNTDYQAAWLPSSSQPVTAIETGVNLLIPVVVALAIFLVLLVAAIRVAGRERAPPSHATIIACCLILALAGLAAFQGGAKNFYEVTLHAPVLVLAVVLTIPDAQRVRALRKACYVLAFLLIGLATASQFAFVTRFASAVTEWRKQADQFAHRQQKLSDFVARCGIAQGPEASRIAMDDFAYTVLWRTREPIIMPYFNGFWATGMDQQKVLRDRKISALVGACYMFPPHYRALSLTSDDGYCCTRTNVPPN